MNSDKIRKVLFVINPVSGSNQEIDLKSVISETCPRHGLRPQFFETTGDHDQEKIKEAIAGADPYAVVAVGGDGTVNLVAGLIINSAIKLGIIPTGSANGMAFELNIPGRIDESVAIIGADVSKRIDLLRINKKHLAIHLSDLGMNARIIKRFDQEKIRGLYGYARQFFKELKSPSHFRCTIACDGQKRRHKYKVVMIAMLNTHFFGTGAVVNPTGKINDGRFEIVVIKPYPWYYIFHMMVAFFTGHIHRLRHVRTLSCQQAIIEMVSPQDLQVDGEPIGLVNRVKLEVLPLPLTSYTIARKITSS
ncbi:diacylglycerol/lipid kinase family protein [Geofilum rubicundum]|uniref:Transcription regulator n=1 Tax=Geofilum rubicundum JCM 15548 TaxID=1236989 RepID=A0A0E9M1K7_9BACT|nr:diacylglycerol kinase family protein [Geofilum rubicundum]GAO31256.1 transcription regulator [Geofilum rubicundum JCM 15548]